MSDFSNLDQSSQISAHPSRYKFLSELDLSPDVIRRLSLHLDRIVEGSSEVYLTPIGKNLDTQTILEDFDLIFKRHSSLMNDDLTSFEMTNRSKFGPRSISKPWSERKSDLEAYFSNASSTLKPEFYTLNRSHLRPINLSNAVRYLKNNTNSGLPYYTRKSRVKDRFGENISEILNQNYPCILFTRTQEGNKTRNVWGYPISDTLKEMMFYVPLLAYQKSLSWRSALIGPDKVDFEITKMFNSVKGNEFFYSVDFSSYDTTVSSGLQDWAFDYISSLFQPEYHSEIINLGLRFKDIPIVTPDGIKSGHHGVPSGATFTNEVDSIVQFSLANECGINHLNFQIQGDDGLYKVTVNELDKLNEIFRYYGLNVNEAKSALSSNYAIYLQKLYHKDYSRDGIIGGIYSVYRALNRIVHQERYSDFEDYGIKGQDYYSIRTICILENCKYHPLFHQLIEYVYHLDKYRLKFSGKSLSNYNRMITEGKGATGIISNQYGDNLTGIHNFETVKYLSRTFTDYTA